VTDIPDVCEDDLVTLIGEDHGQVLTAQEVGTMAGSFNYELVCDVGRRVPRVYYEGGRAVKTVSYL
ncbi:MAG: alanine racemase C-terminal domain-containing protein, partial [Catenibacillus sp.]